MENKGFDIANAAGTFGMGAATGVASNLLDIAFGGMRQKQELKGQKKALEQQNAAQLDMWNKTNFEAQKQHIKNAGLSTGLIYGMGGAGGATTGAGGTSGPKGGTGGGGMDIAGAAQVALMKAQADNLDANTAEVRSRIPGNQADPALKGSQTDLNRQEIENKKLQAAGQKLDNELKGWDVWQKENYFMYEAGQIVAEYEEKVAQARSAKVAAQIDEATMEKVIEMKGIEAAGMELENRAKKKGIQLTDAQIENMKGMLQVAIRNAIVAETNATANVAGAMTNAARLEWDKTIHDISDSFKLGVETVGEVVNTVARGAIKGAKGTPRAKPNVKPKGTYNKWGTKTAPRGYDLK